MKHQIVHTLQKYPPIRLLFAMGLAPPGYALLETGRKTGKPCQTPVGNGRAGNRGRTRMNAGYVRNIAKNPRVRLELREGLRARWHNGTAHVLAGQVPGSATNAAAVRLFETNLFTVRIDLDG